MKDPRIDKLASLMVEYSTDVRPGDKVLIELFDAPLEVGIALSEAVFKAGGIPMTEIKNLRLQRALYINGDVDYFTVASDIELYRMKIADCYIGIRGGAYDGELVDVPPEKMSMYEKYIFTPVHLEERCRNTKWVITRYPHSNQARDAGMSYDAYEDFFFDACTGVDFRKMSGAMDSLKDRFDKTDKVRITGAGTDLRLSIKDYPAMKAFGKQNIPDGEVYTAPVVDSAEGTIQFNTPSTFRGFTFQNIKLVYKNGKIVEASANDTKRINQIFNADEGASFIGEFAIGTNPLIDRPMNSILFDEKIIGSIHIAAGDSLEGEADNGNRSSIHWDMVLMQTPKFGGGELWFDDILIRKDGEYIIDELKCLNKANLLS